MIKADTVVDILTPIPGTRNVVEAYFRIVVDVSDHPYEMNRNFKDILENIQYRKWVC